MTKEKQTGEARATLPQAVHKTFVSVIKPACGAVRGPGTAFQVRSQPFLPGYQAIHPQIPLASPAASGAETKTIQDLQHILLELCSGLVPIANIQNMVGCWSGPIEPHMSHPYTLVLLCG